MTSCDHWRQHQPVCPRARASTSRTHGSNVVVAQHLRERRHAGGLRWLAPPGAQYQDATSEPGASGMLKLLVNLLAPFAPDEML